MQPLMLYPKTPRVHAAKHQKIVLLADLEAGEEARVLRVTVNDTPCRRRLAELGIAEGMTLAVVGGGETMMVALGNSRFGIDRGCAEHIQVLRMKSRQ